MATNPSAPLPPPLSPETPLSHLPTAQPPSEPQRLARVFFAPSKTFTDLRRSAAWWAPFLIIAIVSVLYIYVVDQKVGFPKVSENLMQLQPKQAERIDNLPPDQRQKVMAQQASITKIISYAVAAIGLLVYLVYAGVLFGTLKFAAGAEIKFGALFALIVYSRLPELLRALLSALSLLAGASTDAFNLQNPLATNPGYFIDASGSAVLRAALTPLDVITIWTLVLLAIGITCISKVKRGTAFAVVFGWFIFTVLARVALAAIT